MIRAGWLRGWGTRRSRTKATAAGAGRRKSARRLSIEYAFDLASAYILAVISVSAILIPLRGHTSVAANVDFAEKNTTAVVVLVVLGTISVAIADVLSLAPTL